MPTADCVSCWLELCKERRKPPVMVPLAEWPAHLLRGLLRPAAQACAGPAHPPSVLSAHPLQPCSALLCLVHASPSQLPPPGSPQDSCFSDQWLGL